MGLKVFCSIVSWHGVRQIARVENMEFVVAESLSVLARPKQSFQCGNSPMLRNFNPEVVLLEVTYLI